MELTDEMIDDAVKCDNCGGCSMKCDTLSSAIRKLSSALKAERAKPKVWDGAPDDCVIANVEFYKNTNCSLSATNYYTRELPKSREESPNIDQTSDSWDGVIDWDSRPWADEVRIAYCRKDMTGDRIGDRIATIKRPKSRERLIAEKYGSVMQHKYCWNKECVAVFENQVEAAILEAKGCGE